MKDGVIGLMAIYLLGFFLVLGIGMWKNKKKQKSYSTKGPKLSLDEISVIIPFRNESQRIQRLIESLNASEKLPAELIFIDDHSEDNTCELILQSLHPDSQIIQMEEGIHGKKRAIEKGVNVAKGKYMLTLDADVYFSKDYFSRLEELSEADLYLLPAVLKAEKFWQHILEIDLLLINAINTGLSGLKRPIIASGANMLFKKESYLSFHKLESHIHVPSGDDIYLLRDFRKAQLDIRVLANRNFQVWTETPQSLNEFLHQRIRWIAKTGDVKDHLSTFLAAFQSVLTLSIIAIMMYALTCAKWKLFGFVYFGKTVVDMLLFGSFFLHFKRPIAYFLIPLYQFIFPIYNALLILILPFFKPKWKGRSAHLTAHSQN